MKKQRNGFTLIELLVVVTIIVVLLALLVPAIDKAIYQAELAVCGARLKSVSGSITNYAFDQRRWYPHRPGVNPTANPVHSWRDTSLKTVEPFGDFDDRDTLAPYISINKLLQCPLVKAVDLERSTANTYSSYQLWFGFRFYENGNKTALPGMMKLGDSLRWQGYKFDVLASDEDSLFEDSETSTTSHPDKSDTLSNSRLQDQIGPNFGSGVGAGYTFTWSRWEGPLRGLMDRNFGLQDGAVVRLTDISLEDVRDEHRGLRNVPINSITTNHLTRYGSLPGS